MGGVESTEDRELVGYGSSKKEAIRSLHFCLLHNFGTTLFIERDTGNYYVRTESKGKRYVRTKCRKNCYRAYVN